MNVNDYLAKTYPNPPCWALVADWYVSELDLPVTEFRTVNTSVRAIAEEFRIALHKNPDGFQQVDVPVENCVVLMSRLPGVGVHHCGVFIDGSVLHALETGVVYQDMASLGDAYPMMEFWSRAA